MSPEREAALERLLDEAEIRELLLAFPRALDAKDWAAYAETFAADGTFEIMGQRRTGRADIAAGPARDLERFGRLQHFITNETIRVDGDRAHAQTYLLGVHVPDAGALDRHADIGGRYTCACARTAEGWRLESVRLEILWTGGLTFGIEAPPEATTAPPSR